MNPPAEPAPPVLNPAYHEAEMWGTELHPEDVTTRYLGLPWNRKWRD